MAPHSSTLAWKIPWMEEPCGPQSMGSLRVGQDSATSLSLFTFMHWRRKWQPTLVFLPGESQGRGDLVGCRPWVTRSWTLLKQLSSSRETHGASRVAQWLKNLPANAGDKGSISVSERSTGEGNGSPLQCSCLGNPMDRGAWQAAVNGVTKELDSTK